MEPIVVTPPPNVQTLLGFATGDRIVVEGKNAHYCTITKTTSVKESYEVEWTPEQEKSVFEYFRPIVNNRTYGECTSFGVYFDELADGREQLVFHLALEQVLTPEEAKRAGVQTVPPFVFVVMPSGDVVRIPCIVHQHGSFQMFGTIQNGSDVCNDNDINNSLTQLLSSSTLQSTDIHCIISQLESNLQRDLTENEKIIIRNKMKELAGGKFEPFVSLILPHLLLGSYINSTCLESLQALNVKAIVNVTTNQNRFIEHFVYLKCPITDENDSDVQQFFDTSYELIEKTKNEGGRVLVHCQAGVSRSVAVVLAYLVKSQKWSLKESFEYVNERRKGVGPNAGFWKQLIQMEMKERGEVSISDSDLEEHMN